MSHVTALARDQREALRARVQRRTLAVVVVSQVLGGAGLAAGISVGALLAEDLLGTDSVAGLPTALFTLGSALTAFLVGRLTQRWGRRSGLGIGFAAGGLGALGVIAAAVIGNAPLLFASFFVYGAGTATNLLARYAGGDLAPASRRATAISVALVSTTLGAVAGPNLIDPLGRFAEALGIPALAGPFLLAGAAYVLAGATLVVFLRPDPFLLARELDAAEAEERRRATGPGSIRTDAGDDPENDGSEPGQPAMPTVGVNAFVGATIMVLTQITMVAIMTMTPVHMRAHGHELGAVGLVISLHVAAMFLPSLLTGWLVDRIGRTGMAIASGALLLAAGLVAALAPVDSLGMLVVALVLLGLGWNAGLISGTTLVVDATVPANRARTQGTIDVLVALAGAGGGAMSGVVMAATSFTWLSVCGGVLALLLIPALLWARSRQRAAASGR